MMIRKYILFITLLGSIAFFTTSCDDDNETYQSRMEDERNERQRYLEEVGITKDNLLEAGIYYQELYSPTDKTNAKKIEVGDEVVIYYTGHLLNGLVFYSNVLSGKYEPMTVRIVSRINAQIIRQGVAVGNTVPGWPPALLEMHEGTKARIVVPSNLAYSFYGTSNPQETFITIPGNTTLVFEIEVEEVRKEK